jgi:hypothetical protein
MNAQTSPPRVDLTAPGPSLSRGGELAGDRSPWRAARRRRRLPYTVAGSLLVIACVVGYAYGAVALGERVQVLAVARPVAAGQQLSAADLQPVLAVPDRQVQMIPASQAAQVLGTTAAVPLVPGSLLHPSQLGPARFPPPGKAVASVACKPGLYPQGLAAGARVAVYVTATGGAPSAAASPGAAPHVVEGVVLGVDLAGDGQGAAVITLLLAEADAPELAAAGADGVMLMQTSPGRG